LRLASDRVTDTTQSEERPMSIETDEKSGGFSAEERAAMKERAQELKAESSRGTRSKKDRESDVLAKITELPEPDRQMALRLHEIVKTSAPALSPKTWYGMPAYALDDKVVCFFQAATKFNTRYATLGFSDAARLDEGDMWATSFGLKQLTPIVEDRIATLIKKALS
jgi:uncharacterized protein YdhG (YjbR/CyaY superfamily)